LRCLVCCAWLLQPNLDRSKCLDPTFSFERRRIEWRPVIKNLQIKRLLKGLTKANPLAPKQTPIPSPFPPAPRRPSPSMAMEIPAEVRRYWLPILLFTAGFLFQLLVLPRHFPPTHYDGESLLVPVPALPALSDSTPGVAVF
jgi:hypothetical protein